MRKKGGKRKSSVFLAAVFALCALLVIPAALVTYVSRGALIGFEMRGGDELRLEYGEEYADEVYAYVSMPIFGKWYFPCERSGSVDSLRPGSYELEYSARVLGRSERAVRYVHVSDSRAPVIELARRQGYSPDWMEGYSEEGYSARDARDGDLTDKVERRNVPGGVEYSVADSSGNRASVTREIDYVNLPALSLIGPESIEINPRPYFADPGCTAVDAQGRDISGFLTVSGQVDSRRAGEYEIVYSLENPSGDVMSLSRRVRVCGGESAESAMPRERTIYLTFDDGPGPYTDALLDLLSAYGAKATFFVTGANSRWYDCIGRAHREGHSIGVHCFEHSYGKLYSSEENYFADLNAIEELIYAQTGEYSMLLRFPGGSSNTASCFNPGVMSRLTAQLESMGYRYFDWNVNSGDAENAFGSGSVASRVIGGCSGKDWAVVLQHDIKEYSVRAVEQILIWGIENGYSFKGLELSSPTAHHNLNN